MEKQQQHSAINVSQPFDVEESWNGEGRQGRSAVWARFPTWGFAALIAYLFTAAGIVAVLVQSNGKTTGTWGRGLSPNTYVSILGLVMNLLLSFAFVEGFTISYWRKVSRGSTISGLHYHWKAGQSLWGAFEGVFRYRSGLVNGLVFIAWVISSARSPLSQSAALVTSHEAYQTNGTMRLQMAQQLPEGYTGYTALSRASTTQTGSLTRDFSSIMRDYSSRTALTLEHPFCGDSCETTLNSFGFCAECTTDVGGPFLTGIPKAGRTYTMFSTGVDIWTEGAVDFYNGGVGGLNVTSYFKTNRTGEDQTITRNCILRPSIMAHPVRFTGDNAVDLLGSWDTDTCVKSLDYQYPTSIISGNSQGTQTTLGGFQLAMSTLFDSSASFLFGGVLNTMNFKGSPANQYVDETSDPVLQNPNYLNWRDPTDDFMQAFREVAFRASLYATSDPKLVGNETVSTQLAIDQDVHYTGTAYKTVYKTDMGRMAGSLVLALLGFLSALPLYYGWWELERDVSMSPVEIAKAFEARVLEGMDHHDAKGLARAGTDLEFRYKRPSRATTAVM